MFGCRCGIIGKLTGCNCNRRQLYRYLRFYRFYPQIVGALSPQLHPAADILLQKLSYSHIDQLVNIDEELKRAFYEIECICGSWSVRELKRQIGSLYYERSGLSLNKEELSQLANSCAEQEKQGLTVRAPYVVEFSGLKPCLVDSPLRNQLDNSALRN